MHLQELKAKSPADLLAYAEELEIENADSVTNDGYFNNLEKEDTFVSFVSNL